MLHIWIKEKRETNACAWGLALNVAKQAKEHLLLVLQLALVQDDLREQVEQLNQKLSF